MDLLERGKRAWLQLVERVVPIEGEGSQLGDALLLMGKLNAAGDAKLVLRYYRSITCLARVFRLSSSIMSPLAKDVKFMPLREAASLAGSRSVRGMRMVTGASSESRR